MAKKKTKKTEKTEKPKGHNYLAVVRVRGIINLTDQLKKTFESLNLHNKNWCVVLEDKPETRGMVAKVKDYVTWGTVSNSFVEELVKKRGEEVKKGEKSFNFGGKSYKRYIRLSPPKKGYGRKGIKVPFNMGGALGEREGKIEKLIERMI